MRGGNRRGVRLERFFWNTLKQFTQSRKSTLGQMVEDISHVAPETGNLTSAIRVACTRWLTEENAELKKLASLRKVNTLLRPALAGLHALFIEEDTCVQPGVPTARPAPAAHGTGQSRAA